MDNASGSSKAKKGKGPATIAPRRYWTRKEEEVLLNLLEGLVSEGWKCDGTFQGGYMNRLVKEMNESLPGCGLNKKHVRSKLTVWKRTHFIILGMLACSGAAGFTMDPTLNMLIEDKQDAWADYAKAHPAAVQAVKGKTFPWHVRWKHIFGTDNAAGGDRVDMDQARNEVGSKEKYSGSGYGEPTNQSNYDDTRTDCDDASGESKGSSKEKEVAKGATSKKRKSVIDDPEKITMMIGDWMESTKSQIGDVSSKMMGIVAEDVEQPGDDSSKRARIYSAVAEACVLEMDDLITATHHLSHNRVDMDIFWSMPAEARGKFVGMILRGKLA